MQEDMRKAKHLEDSDLITCCALPLDCLPWKWKHYNPSTRQNVHAQDKE